ncbi:MAG: TlpA family protein disulfide reductase [Bdellovibrionales bacterium]|nr:TlpA family protein disulfide reductase [Bdellovibrionales bacterium]
MLLIGIFAISLIVVYNNPDLNGPDHQLQSIPSSSVLMGQNLENLENLKTKEFPIDSLLEIFSLEEISGPVLLSFWASWCYPCVIELPHLNQLRRNFEGLGLKILLVNLDQSEQWEEAQALLQKKAPDLDFRVDKRGQISKSFEIDQVPTHILSFKEGEVFLKWVGGTNWRAPSIVNSIKTFLNGPREFLSKDQWSPQSLHKSDETCHQAEVRICQ